jgi:hypothetical protein
LPLAGSSVTRPKAPDSGLPSICIVPLKLPTSTLGGGGTFASTSSSSDEPTARACAATLVSNFFGGVVTRGGAPSRN